MPEVGETGSTAMWRRSYGRPCSAHASPAECAALRLCGKAGPRLCRQLDVLARADHQHFDVCGRRGNDPVAVPGGVLLLIDRDPQIGARRACSGAHLGCILPAPAGEYEHIDAAHRRRHRGDARGEAVDVGVEGETATLVAILESGEELAHVAGAAPE